MPIEWTKDQENKRPIKGRTEDGILFLLTKIKLLLTIPTPPLSPAADKLAHLSFAFRPSQRMYRSET
jgi:hypothetical protein